MKHQTRDTISRLAEVLADPPVARMSREGRLQRWAELLDRDPNRRLNALEGTEYRTGKARSVMRSDNSPISVALEDPVLRFEGLKDDSYGAAKTFFALSDRELHEIVCYCHYVGGTMKAETAASRVRWAAGIGPSAFARAWHALTGVTSGS